MIFMRQLCSEIIRKSYNTLIAKLLVCLKISRTEIFINFFFKLTYFHFMKFLAEFRNEFKCN